MTRKIYAIALALGMFAALSTPSHAALSGADRTVAATQVPATVEANAATGFAADAPAATTATTAQAAPVTELRKPVIQKAKAHVTPAPRFASRFGYPCH